MALISNSGDHGRSEAARARAVAAQAAEMSCLAGSRKSCTVARLDPVAPWVWQVEINAGGSQLCADIDLKMFETHWSSSGEETMEGAGYVACPKR